MYHLPLLYHQLLHNSFSLTIKLKLVTDELPDESVPVNVSGYVPGTFESYVPVISHFGMSS